MAHDINFDDGLVIDTYEIARSGAKIVFRQVSRLEEVTLKKKPKNMGDPSEAGMTVKASDIVGLVYELDGTSEIEISGKVTDEEKDEIEEIIMNSDTVLPDAEEVPEFIEQLKELGWTQVNHFMVFKEL
jgi:hypothetical protein